MRLRAFLNTGLNGAKPSWLRRMVPFQPDGGGVEQVVLVLAAQVALYPLGHKSPTRTQWSSCVFKSLR